MKRKHIDAMREVRLWIGQVVVPATALVMAVSPEMRQGAAEKLKQTKEKISGKIKEVLIWASFIFGSSRSLGDWLMAVAKNSTRFMEK